MKNELQTQKSLYLKQHENNPVAWQPYSEETIDNAKKLNRPLFISIGYSSCHWCHVMAHESFENEVTAELINKYFVPIKIDREEFPDADKHYQFYLHATGKRGGWPLSVFCLPDGRPYFGGTYFPPKPSHGLPAFAEIVVQLGQLYQNNPTEAAKYSDNYGKFFDKFIAVENKLENLESFDFHTASEFFSKTFDMEYGGLGKDAKFPNTPVLNAVFDYYDTDIYIRDFLKLTADKLCTSGIYDHVNGGFYRYAVDRKWTVPHFEKMLYDNAQNTYFLLMMFEKTENPLYLKIAEKTIDFMLHEFNTDFGFISAMDADSLSDDNKLVEGYYYLLCNADIEPIKDKVELNEGVLTVLNTDYENYVRLEQHLHKLKEANIRDKPLKDAKIILSQNMLFCKTLLKMFEVSGNDFYMEQASALLGKLRHFQIDRQSIFRINYAGEIMTHTTLEDYAFTIDTFLMFFDITKEKHFLNEAAGFANRALNIFCENGLIYLDTARTVVETFDDSIPNSISLFTDILINKGNILGIPVEKSILDFAADRLIKYAGGHPTLFKSLKEYLNK